MEVYEGSVIKGGDKGCLLGEQGCDKGGDGGGRVIARWFGRAVEVGIVFVDGVSLGLPVVYHGVAQFCNFCVVSCWSGESGGGLVGGDGGGAALLRAARRVEGVVGESDAQVITMKMEILLEQTSNKLMVGALAGLILGMLNGIMAASAIAISSDSSDESVGSPPSRVILFGDIPTVIPSTSVVAPETSTIAPVISSAAPVVETTLVASPTGLCGLIPYSDSDSDSPDEMSSPEHISPLPAISPFLCTDSSEAPDSSDGPPSQDLYVAIVAR
ncbi:hypothetical protein Tco_0527486 [Tanacetum coccineum]